MDYVLKDDVIISGVIHNKEDIVSNKCAVGKVFGEVWYKIDVELPTKYHEVNTTHNNKYRLRVKFLDKIFILFGGYETFKETNYVSFDNKLLPISFGFSKFEETIVDSTTFPSGETAHIITISEE